jgi:hypothetical protein
MLRNEQTKQVRLPEVYKEDENAKVNVNTWMTSQFIHEAVPKLLPVSPASSVRRSSAVLISRSLTND